MTRRSTESIAGAITIALHALAAAALLSYEPARSTPVSAVPVMVDLISPPRIDPKPLPPVRIRPPKPKPVAKPVVREPDPPPLLAAPIEAPAPIEAASPPPPPTPPPVPTPIVVAAPPAVVPVTPPIFAADYLDNPPPRYPALSRRLGEEGRVVLRVLVSAGGGADAVEVRSSSGHARLDDAARETVRHWRFVPAKRGEQPVPAWVLIPISFRLEG
jgi:protein TonB